jgi:two-component system, chemotaxis family, protein-glutamate methylesterase/glutaminase
MNANDDGRAFPVVCIGGSAGGLDAYIRLLRHLPADMGVAIVIVNHVRIFVRPYSTKFCRPMRQCRSN